DLRSVRPLLKGSGNIGIIFIKNNFKPSGIFSGVFTDILSKRIDIDPFPIGYFFGINMGSFVIMPYQYMVKFVFGEAVVKRGFINKGGGFLQLGRKPHFFHEPSFSGFYTVFSFSLMTATGIGP